MKKFDDADLGHYSHHFLRWLAVAVKGGGYVTQYFVMNVNHEAPSLSTETGCSILPNKGRLTVGGCTSLYKVEFSLPVA